MDPTRFLPHAPPLRLLTRVDEVAGDTVRAVGCIPPDAPGAGPRWAPAILGLELGAQSTAMIGAAALAAETVPAPRIGYLVSIRSASFERPSLPVGVELAVEARRVGGAGGLELFEVAVTVPGDPEPAVRAVVGTMLTDRTVTGR
ncbi:MAG TPA: hypothetical protein VMT85_19095 [Thermoanaerobaculia bacterium]|nr:hypothetical protein [Thermoanaerobaculia bacterium]